MRAKGLDAISTTAVADALGTIELSDVERSAFVEALSGRWPRALRHRREVSVDQLPVSADPVPWYSLARVPATESGIKPSRCLSYAAGDYYLQDPGSLLALAACGADTSSLAGKLVCDLCASPGGKATGLLEAIGDSGFVLANEPIKSRIPPLLYNLSRCGSDRFAVSALDPQDLADRLGGVFDLVLVDAPCSGQALMSRGRQSVAALSAKQIAHSAARQNRILDAAVGLLCEGGRLVYSTCTFAEAENESQLTRLIDAGMVQPDPVDRLSDYQSVLPACYRLWPHRHRCAGAFASAGLCHNQHRAAVSTPRRRSSSKTPTDWSQWYDCGESLSRAQQYDSVLVAWPEDAPDWTETLAIAGPEIAHRTGQTWKPSHAGALRRIERGRPLRFHDVDGDAAARFLSGNTIECGETGWHVVRYQGRPLGWVKSNGSIGKNHLPAAGRVQGELTHR